MDTQTQFKLARYLSIAFVILGVAFAGMAMGTYLGYEVANDNCEPNTVPEIGFNQSDVDQPACVEHINTLAVFTNALSLIALFMVVSGLGMWWYLHNKVDL